MQPTTWKIQFYPEFCTQAILVNWFLWFIYHSRHTLFVYTVLAAHHFSFTTASLSQIAQSWHKMYGQGSRIWLKIVNKVTEISQQRTLNFVDDKHTLRLGIYHSKPKLNAYACSMYQAAVCRLGQCYSYTRLAIK